MMPELPLPPAARIVELRDSGLTWREIATLTRCPVEVCQSVHGQGAVWPKLVTLIEEDGTAWFVRYP